MQSSSFSRPRSGRTTRVAGMGAVAIGLAVLVTGSWLACSPGELDCGKVNCDAGGTGGGGGGIAGSTGGAPAACGNIGIKSLAEVETKFIATKCGGDSGCHQAVFPPRNLNNTAKIRPAIVGVNGQTLCKTDFYVNKDDPAKSYLLAKVSAMGDTVDCPTPDSKGGGARMPLKKGTIDKPDTRLSDDEIACLTWWVESIAK